MVTRRPAPWVVTAWRRLPRGRNACAAACALVALTGTHAPPLARAGTGAVLAGAVDPVVPLSSYAVLAQWQIDEPFDEVIARMWQASPTFRQQCRRLAASASAVQVRVRLADFARDSSVRARATVAWSGGRPASAAMFVPISRDLEELIAHELEHVLEQVDGIVLAEHVGSGAAWRQGADGYETRRAVDAGRRVALEVATWRRSR